VISATTDGFLTDCPSPDTSGPLCTLFADLRQLLGHPPTVLVEKHRVRSVVAMRTRGQLTYEGGDGKPVLAKAGVKVPKEVEDPNAWMVNLFLKREYGTKLTFATLRSLREQYFKGGDLIAIDRERRINLDVDCKRKLVILGERAGHLWAVSEPWTNADEFNTYRDKFEEWRRSRERCLKTLADWNDWQDYQRGDALVASGLRRRGSHAKDAVRIIVRGVAQNLWGLGGVTYRDFAEGMGQFGYQVTEQDLKNGKKRPVPEQPVIEVTAETTRVLLAARTICPKFDLDAVVTTPFKGPLLHQRAERYMDLIREVGSDLTTRKRVMGG
jgi:hypothetical protein